MMGKAKRAVKSLQKNLLRFTGSHAGKFFLALLLSVTVAVGLIALHAFYYKDKIYPGISVVGISLSGKTKNEASQILSEKVSLPKQIRLTAKEKEFDLSLVEIEFRYDFAKSVEAAFGFYRPQNIPGNILNSLISPFNQKSLNLETQVNEEKLNEYLNVVAGQVTSEPVYPSVDFVDKEVVIEKGVKGEQLDTPTLKKELLKKLSAKDFSPTSIPFTTVDPTISENEADALAARAKRLVGKSISLVNEYDTFSYREAVLFTLLGVRDGYDNQQILSFIDKDVAPLVNRDPQNALFRVDGGQVVEFHPAKDGLEVDALFLASQISKSLSTLEEEVDINVTITVPVVKTSPAVTTSEVNNLGIKELLGRGTSKFAGSIPGRRHNISLASSKFNGILIPPNTLFSFNETLGDVSVYTGYKQAYVIKDGKTVLGDGGGVCQVSTTFFRAILNAGLPIVERRAHSYRVGYYEQDSPPGLDATVFDPTTDLKFLNDTPGHLLIQTIYNEKNSTLAFEIYGTSDGRIATVGKPVTTSSIAPPEDSYVDDPSLPAGTVKQIEYKAWGAKVVFNYKVERNQEILIDKQFVSNYRPWQAVYLRGTGPQP